MKCDSCCRERTNEQLSIHDGSAIRFCKDRADCHEYTKRGIYNEVAKEIINMIIRGTLLKASCSTNSEHGCLVVWSSQAQEQISAHLQRRLK